MKILYLCPDLGIPVLGRKGASVHVRELAGALARAGHEVTLVAQTLTKSPWEKPSSIDVPCLEVKPGNALSNAVQAFKAFNETLGAENPLPGELRRILYNQEFLGELRRRFENDPPDFIYERASLYATAGILAAREFNVPLLLELNAPLATEQSLYRSSGFGELAAQAERWTLAHADAVLVVSAPLKLHVLDCGVESQKIHVLPNGVNPALFQPGPPDPVVRRRLKLDGAPVLGFVGGLRPWHGVEVLPELLGRLTRKHGPVRLVIAGDGPLRKDLEGEFKSRGLERQVIFTGLLLHEQIPEVIRQFDIALAPYTRLDHDFYFSPLKLFEYMACGVPVVAADTGQISEVVTHARTGLLYAPGDLDALTAHCGNLLDHPGLGRALGEAAAEHVSRSFTWNHNAERIVALAGELLGTARMSNP